MTRSPVIRLFIACVDVCLCYITMMVVKRSICRTSLVPHLISSQCRHSSGATYYSKLLAVNAFSLPKSDSDVVSVSQKLLLSEGSIYCSSPGSFILMPMAVRSLEKLIKLIDQEMKLMGGQKIIMPSLIPTSLLKKSGRFESVSSELFTFPYQDLLLAPTHEEVVCQLVNRIPNLSRKSLPLYLYQITTKYRNEKRPRSGLLRTREFLMKDLYTFDVDHESARQTYARVCQAYDRIFDRLRIPVCKVSADTGSIGGEFSHEYHVLSNAGQDKVLICSKCSHAMSEELVRLQGSSSTKTKPIMSRESSPRCKSSLPFSSSESLSSTSSAGLGIREGADSQSSSESGERRDSVVRISSTEKEEIVRELMGAMDQRTGRKDEDIVVSADNMREHGSPEAEEHESGESVVLKCSNCSAEGSNLIRRRGIEVGHTFLLGNKYTEPFDVRFTDVNSDQVLTQMGCYGIGVTRLLAASLEALSPTTNEQHMTWPQIIAPFDVVFVPPKSGSREEETIGTEFMHDFAHKLASSTGLDVLIDDRTHLTIGRRRKDHWKAGVPFAVIAGKAVASSSIPLFEVISYNTTAGDSVSQSHHSEQQHQRQDHDADHPSEDRDGGNNNVTDARHGSECMAGKSQGFDCEFLTYTQTVDYFSKPYFLSRWLTTS